jgi:hypothetical protein
MNWEDKEARFGCCMAEPSGNLYSMIAESQRSKLSDCAARPDTLPPIGDCTPEEEYDAVTGSDTTTDVDDNTDTGEAVDSGANEGGGMIFIIAGVVLLILIIIFVYCCCFRNNDENTKQRQPKLSTKAEHNHVVQARVVGEHGTTNPEDVHIRLKITQA